MVILQIHEIFLSFQCSRDFFFCFILEVLGSILVAKSIVAQLTPPGVFKGDSSNPLSPIITMYYRKEKKMRGFSSHGVF